MWPDWTNTLTLGQWLALGAVPPALIALYFLKLKRQPLLVPSTYLWQKSVEDLHVNSFWQRLRKSLLLLLQLLLVALVTAAVVRPSWQGTQRLGERTIILIDNSASMGATDIKPTRLDEAKRRALELIDRMDSDDKAMVVSFADGAQVAQSYTPNRQELRRAIQAITQSDRTTSIGEALRVAGGLANPGRSGEEMSDVRVAEAKPAKLYILSDGKFEDVSDFSLGNLDPVFVPIGEPGAANVAILAFSTERRDDKSDERQAFARVENFGRADAVCDVTLYLDGELLDASQVTVPAGESSGVAFDLGELQTGVLELRLAAAGDELAIDNRAWATINSPRRAKVLLVTPGNRPMELALATERAAELAQVRRETPAYLDRPEYVASAAEGEFDFIIYDRCQPKELPQCHTLFIGRLPPGKTWKAKPSVVAPQIIDTDRTHPLMQMIDLGDVLVAEGTPLEPPAGSRVLIDTNQGPLLAIAPRDGFEDAVLGFEVASADALATNWPIRRSFTVFALNLVQYFGATQDALAVGNVRPGQPVVLRPRAATERIRVTPPDGSPIAVSRGSQNAFHFSATATVGIYEVRVGEDETGRFAVNLFDGAESAIFPRAEAEIRIGHVKVEGQTAWETGRREAWKLLVLAALAILLLEWYIYNRRVV